MCTNRPGLQKFAAELLAGALKSVRREDQNDPCYSMASRKRPILCVLQYKSIDVLRSLAGLVSVSMSETGMGLVS